MILFIASVFAIDYRNMPSSFYKGREGARQQSCSPYNNGCSSGDQVDNHPEFDDYIWQTPPRGSEDWYEGYQGFSHVMGYAQIQYHDTTRKAATVTVIYRTNPTKDITEVKFKYNGGDLTSNNVFEANESNMSDDLVITIVAIMGDGTTEYIDLEPIDFVWTAPVVNTPPNYENGQKGAIVEMFGWPHAEIEKECEMLGKAGYLAVKVFPPMDHVMAFDQPQSGYLNPWYWMYQPVSYRLSSRAGSRAQFKSMIRTCRKNNVRVYADAVVNHMAAGGNDVLSHVNGGGYPNCNSWPPHSTFGELHNNKSPNFGQGFNSGVDKYTGKPNALEYPAAYYIPSDFHCERSLNSWTDPFVMGNGWLVGLADLNTGKTNVQERIATYFTELMGIGVSGIRMDAAKHISPDDLGKIYGTFKKFMGGALPEDFMAYLELITGGEKSLLWCDYSSYQFSTYLTEQLKANGLSDDDVTKVKIWMAWYPQEWPLCDGSDIIPYERLVIGNDDHDQQKPGSSSRDMHDKGSVLVIEKNIAKHRGFEVELMSRTDRDWKHKLLLSSYTLVDGSDGSDGAPDGYSDCSLAVGKWATECKHDVKYAPAHDPNVCGYTVEGWASGHWTRTHRDKSIILAMREWMGLSTDVTNEEIGLPSQCQEDSPN